MKTLLTLILTLSFLNVLTAQEKGGPYTPDENTVLLMHFDGDVTNSANVGNNGIEHGSGVSYETGVHGNALRLDNSTGEKQSWIEVPFYDELNFTEEFSIECWFKINSWGENHTEYPFLLKKGESWTADYEVVLNGAAKRLQANLNCQNDEHDRGTDAGTVNNIIEPNTWYHLSVTYSAQQQHMYLLIRDENFKEYYASRGFVPTLPFNSTDKLFIGFGNNGNAIFDGWIDELRISNKYKKYRDDIISPINTSAFKDSIAPLLRDKWKVYFDPIRHYFPVDTLTGEMHKGNSCGMTMFSRTVHFWEYPRFPKGKIEYWTDNFHWLADYDNSEYEFDLMPNTFSSNPDEEEYGPSSFFTIQLSTATRLHYDNMSGMPKLLKDHFLYNDSARMISREEYTKQEWINIFKNELNHGRPIMIGGLAERYWNGGAGHFYVCDGYNSEDKFHTDISMGDYEFWIDIDSFPYGMNQDIVIFIEPDWQGKALTLDYPKGNEYFQKQSEIEIKWSSTNVNSILLEYTSDGGKTYHIIADNIDASKGKYLWTIPEIISKEYKVRICDSEDGNVYRRSKTFNVFNQQIISFNYPLTNTYFQAGTTQPIYWQSEGIPAFKLEYSTGGKDWNMLCDSVTSVSGFLNCTMPEISDNQVVLKATNLINNEVFFKSDTFRILSEPLVGGVYNKNENTVLLLHFEEDILNTVQNSVIPEEKSVQYKIFEENYDLNLGKAFRINNTADAGWHCLRTPHTKELNLGNNWTIETWVKYNDIGTAKTQFPLILEKGESFGIWLAGDSNGFGGYARFNDNSEANFFQNQHLDKNKWYHVAITSNSSTRKVKFYVHDEHRQLIFEDSRNFPAGGTGELNHSTNDLFIGGVDGGSNIQFDGWIDELRITKEPVDYSSMVTKVVSQNFSREILCYPNPVTERSVIQFSIAENENVNLSVFDIQGRKICTLLNKNLNAGVHTIPFGNQIKNNGVYLLQLANPDGASTLKLIVNK